MVPGLLLAATDSPLVVPLTLNQVSRGDVFVVLRQDDVLMRVDDLEKAGLHGATWNQLLAASRSAAGSLRIENADAVSLRALAPSVRYVFDEASLSLAVDVDPQLLGETAVTMQGSKPSDIIYSRDLSTFFNYSLSSTGFSDVGFFGETGTSVRGSLLYNSFSRTSDGAFIRNVSSLNIDDRNHLRRWTIGDGATVTDALGGAPLIGGFTVSRNFNLDPYFVRYPALNLRGTALTPSRVDVYVNGMLVSQQELPPGPFELRNLPVSAGAGNTQLVVRDAFGGEHTESTGFYYSTAVLAKGLSEYTYSAGLLRDNFGTKSFDYGDAAVLAYHRVGITDRLTVGGRLEGSRHLWSGGPTASTRTRFGDFDASFAASRDEGRTGNANQFGYRYLSRRISFGGTARHYSRDYVNLTLPQSIDRPLRDISTFVGILMSRGSLTAQYTALKMRDQPDSKRLFLLSNLSMTSRTSAFVSVGTVREGGRRHAEYFAGVSIYAGGNVTANVAISRQGDERQTLVEVQRPLPVGTGFGYRLQAQSLGDNGTGIGALQYQTDFGRYEVGFDPYHLGRKPQLNAAGGFVYQAGAFVPTRPVQDSFALVRVPGVEDVRVYGSNQLIGRTNADGDLLVPNLLSYYGNRLRIEDKDIPLDYEVRAVERTIGPPFRGGALVEFPVERVQTVTGSIAVKTNEGEVVPSFGELTLVRGSDHLTSPVGRNGEFYFENASPGSYQASVQSEQGGCKFALEIPSGKASVVKLGRLLCAGGGGKP